MSDKLQIAFSSDSCGIPLAFDSVARVNIIDVSPLCPASQPLSNCINPSNPFPGVEEHSYELDYTLPTQCPDWKVAWSICCRNPSVSNSIIPSFSSTRIYVEALINNLDVTCNSSPTFIQRPVTYICSGQPVQFNGGATEPDGDSLTFELVDPLDGPYGGPIIPVPYEMGFNEFYPLTTTPINSFNFDNSSGQFSFTPQGQQSGIVAVLVKEYREGKCIGSTMRDMQWVVTNCFNQVPIINPPNNISGAQFTGNTFSVCAGNTLSFNITALDLDPGNVLTVTDNTGQAIPLPGATVITTGQNPAVISFDWPTSLSDTGNYFITFNVRDNGCPTEGEQSVGYNIIVQEGEVLPPQVITYCPSTVDSIQLLPTSTGVGTYTWNPSVGVSDTSIRDPFLTLPPSGLASLVVTYQPPGAGACPILEPFEVMPEAIISIPNDTLTICSGDTIQLQTAFTISGPPVPYAVSWSPAVNISNPSVDSPFVSPTTTTLYNVTATTNNCTYDANVLVRVDQPPVLDPIADQSLCFGDSIPLQVTGSGLANASFSWTPVLGLSDPTIQSPQVSPTTTTTFTVRATNQCGSDDESTTVNVFSPLQVSLGKTDVDCNGAANGTAVAVPFGGSSSGQVYIWTPNVSTTSTASNLTPGTYSVIVADDAGCSAEDSIVIEEPTPLQLSPATVVDVTCFGETTGSVTLSALGGTPGYEYSRDGVTFFSSPTFINLAAGTYSFSVRDQNDCVTTLSNVIIQQPAFPVVATVLNSVSANCTAGGEFLVGASGGAGEYLWSLDGGANFQDSGRFVNLQPGFYQILVQDSSGCEAIITDSIREVSDPVA
ncbi:MAG: SprB repeat-containing protein, partial [Bacteroidota bacterium]